MKDDKQSLYNGLLLASSMFFISLIQAFLLQQYFEKMLHLGGKIRTNLMELIYKKVKQKLIQFLIILIKYF